MSHLENLSPASQSSSSPSFPPLAFHGAPVLTTEMLAQAYEVEAKQIRQNFANNRERFIEGKHFFQISGNDLREFKNCVEIFDAVPFGKRTTSLTLWTERGAARHAKMLNSDRAWDVFEMLEETFFRVARVAVQPTPADAPITPADQNTLQTIVKSKVEAIPADKQPRGIYPQIWSRFNNHFRLSSYKQLPQCRLSEAIAYLMAMELPAPRRALPPAPALPVADVESHFVAIEEHIRHIQCHEEALFNLCGKTLTGNMGRGVVSAHYCMDDSASALTFALRALKSSVRTVIAMA